MASKLDDLDPQTYTALHDAAVATYIVDKMTPKERAKYLTDQNAHDKIFEKYFLAFDEVKDGSEVTKIMEAYIAKGGSA